MTSRFFTDRPVNTSALDLSDMIDEHPARTERSELDRSGATCPKGHPGGRDQWAPPKIVGAGRGSAL